MLEDILMLKFKLLLLLLILPISYLIYHLIGFDSGINAYYEKVKLINSKEIYNRELKLEITDYKNKLKLLNPKGSSVQDVGKFQKKTVIDVKKLRMSEANIDKKSNKNFFTASLLGLPFKARLP